MSEDAKVVWLDGAKVATVGVPVENVCDAAKEACEEVVILGYEKGGAERMYVAASFSDRSSERTVWLIERAKNWLLAGCPAEDDQ